MLHLANELLTIEHGVDYNSKPVTVGHTSGNRSYTDNMIQNSGVKVGRGGGPVIEIDIVAIPNGARSIEIWSHDMDLTQPGIIYPIARFNPTDLSYCGTTILKDFYFRQLKWLNSDGDELDPIKLPQVIGKRLETTPIQYDLNVT